jgi:hypothetical protein
VAAFGNGDGEMTQTIIQKTFKPFKDYLPDWIWNPIRSLLTAVITPISFSLRSGHLRSSFKRVAVSKSGEPIPWYSYPCLDFLRHRSYAGKRILEFGGGQSTLWWARRAQQVVIFEGDEEWYDQIKITMPANTDIHLVSMESPEKCTSEVNQILDAKNYGKFDVIIIDGLYRFEMIDIAKKVMADLGAIICDDAEGYGFYEGFKDSGLNRVDFFGYAPCVVLPHCTSIFFGSRSFLFESQYPIAVIAKE